MLMLAVTGIDDDALVQRDTSSADPPKEYG